MGNSCRCFVVARVKAESPPHPSTENKTEATQDSKPSPADALAEKIRADSEFFRHSTTTSSLLAFNFAELKAATRNFRPDTLLGEGGFGSVFKGWVDEQAFMATRPGTGTVIAVKKLNLEGLQGHKEWLAEVHYLGQLHHPNLVRLIGFCAENDHRLLVYEFMPRGSLENHLFRSKDLSWAIRIKVALGAAKGLTFLHEAEKPVIFRDFKASNILLDSKFNAKLSDFGLAKDGPTGDNTHVSTRVMGTYGYAAPEYVATGHLTAKSDVYSFGVVLLEILTGRRAVDRHKPCGEQNLVEWAKPFLNDRRKVFRIMDPRLEGQYSMRGAYHAANLALRCLNQDAKLRPTMKEVVQFLAPLMNLAESARHSHNLSVQDPMFKTQYDDVARRCQNSSLIWHQQLCTTKSHSARHHQRHIRSFHCDFAKTDCCSTHPLSGFHSVRR